MREHVPFITAWACVLMTAIAAVIDFRSARIPNWLTFPAIIGGPVLWGWYGGVKAFNTEPMLASGLGAVLSGFLCGGTLYFALYRTRISGEHAMGAGDIKLFAALGSLGLIRLGLESMFYAVTAGTLFTLGRLAWRGVLLKTLGNAAFVLLNPILPKARRRELSAENLTKVRFGLSIFVGTLAQVLSDRGTR